MNTHNLLPIKDLKEMAKTRIPIYKTNSDRKIDLNKYHEITQKYIVERMSIYQLAKEYGCSKTTIQRIVKKTLQ